MTADPLNPPAKRCEAAVYVSYDPVCGGAKRHRCTREATTVHKHGMPVCDKHKITSLDFFPEEYGHDR